MSGRPIKNVLVKSTLAPGTDIYRISPRAAWYNFGGESITDFFHHENFHTITHSGGPRAGSTPGNLNSGRTEIPDQSGLL